MAAKIPFVRQVSIVGFIPLIVAYIVAMQIAIQLGHDGIYGILAVIVLFYILRTFVPIEHRKGIRKTKERDFLSAIPHFQKSYDFFLKHAWLDQFRSIFLLTPSGITYKEMALVNIAFAYSQSDEGDKAISWYERALSEYPNSVIVTTALKMMKSTKKVQPGSSYNSGQSLRD